MNDVSVPRPLLDERLKDFLLWAAASGIKRLKIGDLEFEFWSPPPFEIPPIPSEADEPAPAQAESDADDEHDAAANAPTTGEQTPENDIERDPLFYSSG